MSMHERPAISVDESIRRRRSVRGFLPGFAYQCGVLLAGSVGYIEALFARQLNYATAMALTALTVFVIGIVVIALGKERPGLRFGEDGSAENQKRSANP